MEPRIEVIKEKMLVGKMLTMSLTDNRTAELWRSFMPVRNQVTNAVSTELYSMQVYNPSYFANFNPAAEFEKWAAIAVTEAGHIPPGMVVFTIPAGLYAVFEYKGPASEGSKVFQFIFGTWLPGSAYDLDNRPHFEVLGEKYSNSNPDSEEEIWIPIRPKQ